MKVSELDALDNYWNNHRRMATWLPVRYSRELDSYPIGGCRDYAGNQSY